MAAQRGSATSLSGLPAAPAIPPAQRPEVLAAANRWMAWYETSVAAAGGGEAWQGNRPPRATSRGGNS